MTTQMLALHFSTGVSHRLPESTGHVRFASDGGPAVEHAPAPLSQESYLALQAGLKSAREQAPVYLGSFAQFADDEDPTE